MVKRASNNIIYKSRKVITNPKTGDGKPLLNTYSTDSTVNTKIANNGREMYANNNVYRDIDVGSFEFVTFVRILNVSLHVLL